MNAKREWGTFQVGVPSRDLDRWDVDCTPFDTVLDICHVRDAYRIIEDGTIRSSLVWDESRLRNSRTCVSWVSPNTWAPGSIYGDICFEFPWATLVNEKNLFWVEGMPCYNPPAYRILVTDNDAPPAKLRRYDPTRRTGPIYHDLGTDSWYRNGNFTGELLVDGDLSLEDCKQVTFVDHHVSICKSMRKNCPHLGQKGTVAGGQLLAMLIGNRVEDAGELFIDPGTKPRALNNSAERALVRLITRVLQHPKTRGPIKYSSTAAPFLATALFARAGRGGEKGIRSLCGLLEDEQTLRDVLVAGAGRFFDISTLDQIEELE
jgi:hypothetical protein